MTLVRLQFSEDIHAEKSRIWKSLWEDQNYRFWTSAFSEGSHAESDWKSGSRVHFLNNNGDGIFSDITELIDNEKIEFTHKGEIKNFEELSNSSELDWVGAKEIYHLTPLEQGYCRLTVSLDTSPDFENYFNTSFPKALAIVKTLAEN